MPWQAKADAPRVVVFDSGLVSLFLGAWPGLVYLAPTLAGEVIETATFCARGPAFVPPVTMADVVWFGFSPNDGRPHSLLTVTRAIVEQEAFAAYCENPSGSGFTCVDWETAFNTNVSPPRIHAVPGGHIEVEWVTITGGYADIHTDLYNGNVPYGGSTPPSRVFDASGSIVVRSGTYLVGDRLQYDDVGLWDEAWFWTNASGSSLWTWRRCFPGGTEQYVPPANDEDPSVVLPDGTGATLDQLEVKLDAIQQQLRADDIGGFALDLASTVGPYELVGGDLGDAVGLMVTVIDVPGSRGVWDGSPDRYPQLAYITFGNTDGWWPATQIDHTESVWLPLPRGASRYAVQCQPPMRATVTPYRPTLAP